jgi:UDP-N-acetylglucosamine--N-acetylmuramyl-(pentapeptide) pyrophosphoryl-undecaprenol N-acetylglucosamine transferase
MFLPRLMRATRDATRLLDSLRPSVVVNVGGYGSFPATWAARRLGIPYVVVTYDRTPGLVSRLLAPGAAAVASADAASPLPNAVVTGAPVRQALVTLDRELARPAARSALGLPADRFVVGVVGGSLGAAAVNRAVVAAVDLLAGRDDLAVFHVVGVRNLAAAAPARDGGSGILYAVTGFEERMSEVYSAADLMVTRAGAGTIAELATVGVPAIIVPWPGAAEHHQAENARVLADAGAAIVIDEADLSPERLAAEIERLAADRSSVAAMAERSRRAGAVHRSGALGALIDRVGRTGRGPTAPIGDGA